jgi:hypothetical protein
MLSPTKCDNFTFACAPQARVATTANVRIRLNMFKVFSRKFLAKIQKIIIFASNKTKK